MAAPVHTAHHTPSVRIGLAEHALLSSVARYGLLSAEQLCRLHYAPGSLTLVRAKLKVLADSGYVVRLFLPRRSRAGSAPAVFALGGRGRSYLQEIGIEVSPRFRRTELAELGYLHLAHSLAVSEVVLTIELFCRQTEGITLAEYRHEHQLRRSPIRVQRSDGSSVGVIPDGWLDLHLQRTNQRMCLALEVDRGTMMKRQWKRKVEGLVAFAHSDGYQQTFQARSLTIVVIAMSGEARRGHLLRWTEQELTATVHVQEADLFRFLAWPDSSMPPADVFVQPRWYQPFVVTPLPLLSLSEGGR